MEDTEEQPEWIYHQRPIGMTTTLEEFMPSEGNNQQQMCGLVSKH